MNGRITLDRKLLDWEWWEDLPVFRLWIYILIRANWKDEQWQGIVIKRGQFATSFEKLGNATGLSKQQLQTALKKLEKTGEITRIARNKYQIITVEKYDFYQDIETVGNKQARNKQETSKKQSRNNQEQMNKDNKDNKENNNTRKEICERIISYLNEKAERNYRGDTKATIDLIVRLLKDFTEQDFYKVIDNQVARWKDDDKMADFLRPSTLFARTNFENYLNNPPPKSERDKRLVSENMERAKRNIEELTAKIDYVKSQISKCTDEKQKRELKDRLAIHEETLKANKKYIEKHKRG